MGINVLITGGGTGGHIIPGISLYEEFKHKGIAVSMLTGSGDRKYSILGKIAGGDLYYYSAPPFTKNIIKAPFFIIRFFIAVIKAAVIMRKLKIDAVIGMGGYVSAPALAASIFLNISMFLCEQNTVPGKVTTLFAGRAKKIFSTFAISAEYFKEEYRNKIIHAGNPIRKDVLAVIDRNNAKNHFYLKHCKKVVLVMGGSQGALQINELFLEIRKNYSEDMKGVGIIWSTGDYSYKKFKEAVERIGSDGSIYLSPFIDKMGAAYRASDLVISRSGAGGIMELAALGLPSILIPYPHAADDHQEINADVFEKAGASIKLSGENAMPEKAGTVLVELLNNPGRLKRMSEKALSLAKVDAAGDIVEEIIKSA